MVPTALARSDGRIWGLQNVYKFGDVVISRSTLDGYFCQFWYFKIFRLPSLAASAEIYLEPTLLIGRASKISQISHDLQEVNDLFSSHSWEFIRLCIQEQGIPTSHGLSSSFPLKWLFYGHVRARGIPHRTKPGARRKRPGRRWQKKQKIGERRSPHRVRCPTNTPSAHVAMAQNDFKVDDFQLGCTSKQSLSESMGGSGFWTWNILWVHYHILFEWPRDEPVWKGPLLKWAMEL